MSGECNICGKAGCVEMAHARPGKLWTGKRGLYGKVHLVVEGKSLCGVTGYWFYNWSALRRDPPSPTCKKCRRTR